MRKLTITHINACDHRGGAARVAFRLMKKQQAVGHDSTMMVAQKYYSPWEDSRLFRNCTFSLLDNSRIKSSDIIHIHNIHPEWFNFNILPILSYEKPVVWTLHDTARLTAVCANPFGCIKWKNNCLDCPKHANMENFLNETTQLLSSFINFVVPSKWLQNMVEESVLKNKSTKLIYNGVDVKLFLPGDIVAARTEIGIENDLTIGAIGGVFESPWKGPENILKLLNNLDAKNIKCTFLDIGAEKTEEWNIGNNIKVKNFPWEYGEFKLRTYYNAMDILTNASLGDTFSLVTAEAMSCGLPVVVHDVGGIPEIVNNEENSFLVPVDDVAYFTEKVEELINNPDLRSRIGNEARKRIINNFSLDKMAGKYEDFYLQLLEERNK